MKYINTSIHKPGGLMGSLFKSPGNRLSDIEKAAQNTFSECSSSIKSLMKKGFGGHYSETDVQHQIKKWLDNITINLDGACRGIQEKVDRRGTPTTSDKIGDGICRMCDDYLSSQYIVKLERSQGSAMRDEVKAVLVRIKEEALKLKGACRPDRDDLQR